MVKNVEHVNNCFGGTCRLIQAFEILVVQWTPNNQPNFQKNNATSSLLYRGTKTYFTVLVDQHKESAHELNQLQSEG